MLAVVVLSLILQVAAVWGAIVVAKLAHEGVVLWGVQVRGPVLPDLAGQRPEEVDLPETLWQV